MLKKAAIISPIILGVFFLLSSYGQDKSIQDKPIKATITQDGGRPRAITPEASPFLGDKRNMFYYPQDCDGYGNIPEGSRQGFQSAQQAEEAKFKKASACK